MTVLISLCLERNPSLFDPGVFCVVILSEECKPPEHCNRTWVCSYEMKQ